MVVLFKSERTGRDAMRRLNARRLISAVPVTEFAAPRLVTFTCSLAADKGAKCGLGRGHRYFFNAAKQSCESFQYEGCDGNSNNFLSAQLCEQYCGVGGSPNGGSPLQEEKSVRPVVCSGLNGCLSTHECIAIPSKGNVAYRCCPTK
ncbi:Kunitz/Bovine pancreatic trypsin inhibitor domain protein, partial [Teladorsagia circumcincta]